MATYSIKNQLPDPNFKYGIRPGYKPYNGSFTYQGAAGNGLQTLAVKGGNILVQHTGNTPYGWFYNYSNTPPVNGVVKQWWNGMNKGYFSAYVNSPISCTMIAGIATVNNGVSTWYQNTGNVSITANTWTRIVVGPVNMPAYNSNSTIDQVNLKIDMLSNGSVADRFYVDAVMLDDRPGDYNPSATTPMPYIDGDQPGCHWVSNYTGASYQNINTSLSGKAYSTSYGRAGVVKPIPKAFFFKKGASASTARASFGVSPLPAGAVDDFAVAPTGQGDPAMAVVPQGLFSAPTDSVWVRPWVRTTTPIRYPIPGGEAWPTARYASLGFRLPGVATTKYHYMDLAQFEKGPKAAPSAWEFPRLINVTVRPDRINWVKNPSFETDLTNWSATGSTAVPTLTRDSSTARYGSASLKFVLAANPPAWTGTPYQLATTTISGLTVGEQYSFSGYVFRTPGTPRVFVLPTGQIPSGIFSSATPVNDWERVSQTFLATATSMTVSVGISQTEMTSGADAIFWLDGVLCEQTGGVNTFFDGSNGVDYLWEAGGLNNNARSFYYSGRREKTYRAIDVVKQNSPLGSQVNVIFTQ